MPNELIIEQCSPTLAGLKPANMFSYRFRDLHEVMCRIKELNRKLSCKGIRFIPIQIKTDLALIFCYREDILEKVLSDPESVRMLEDLGYSNGSLASFISQLRARFSGGTFPHEVGIFLGYPCEDVRAFMEHANEGCVYTGTWKAYSDPERARKARERFSKCKRVYMECYRNGSDLEKLTIKTKRR